MLRDPQTTDSIDSLGQSRQDDQFARLLREQATLALPEPGAWLIPQRDQLIDGKYRVEQPLGRGGMGAVLRATHVVSGRQVALKWLLPAARVAPARFLREARAAARIQHPNVVNVYDLGTHAGGHYLVMELLHGRTLAEHLRGRKLSPSELAQLMIPTLHGLAAVHAEQVIHRDLKPENVFLCESRDGSGPHPKLLDFGISKILAERDQTRTLTGAGTALGTLPYMSPEQLQDAPSVDARTDIYAAGVMMYEALTGQRPFRASNDGALVLAILAQQPLPPRALEPDLPAELERVVLRAMAKDPRARHESVSALIDELMPWASSAVRTADAAHRARRVRRQRGALALAVALVALVCGVTVAMLGSGAPRLSSETYAAAPVRAAPATKLSRAAPSSAREPSTQLPASLSESSPPIPPVRDGAPHTVRDPQILRPKLTRRPRAGAIRIHQL